LLEIAMANPAGAVWTALAESTPANRTEIKLLKKAEQDSRTIRFGQFIDGFVKNWRDQFEVLPGVALHRTHFNGLFFTRLAPTLLTIAREPRPWPTNHLDHCLIKLWPLVKHYHWSAVDFLFVLRKVLDTADLAPCPNEQKLIAYCADSLSLRYVGLKSNRSHGAESPAYNVALRLCAAQPPDP
jgi:hypothetical protein